MAPNRQPNLLNTITGTHRQPSTLDVITLCWETDRLIRQSRRMRDLEPAREDCAAILDQVEWVLEAIEIEEDSEKKENYERLADELLELHERLLREVSKARGSGDGTFGWIKNCLYVPATYALTVALNSILLCLLYALLFVVAVTTVKWLVR